MEREHSETERHCGGDAHGDEDGVHAVVGGDGAEHEALAHREQPEQDDVGGECPPGSLAADKDKHQHHRHPHGDVVQPVILLDKPDKNNLYRIYLQRELSPLTF